MKRSKILNILFWIALIISIILVIWRIFGNSPTELNIVIVLFLTLMFKVWAISDDLNGFKHEVKLSFVKVKSDINELKKIAGGRK